MLASYHNHTKRCRHASGTEEEYIEKAIEHGYDVIGFADHAPHPMDEVTPNAKMTWDSLTEYVNTLTALKEKYKDRIEIKVGLEFEYYPPSYDISIQRYKEVGIEYLLLGQHVVAKERNVPLLNSFAKTDNRDSYTSYVDLCIEGLRRGVFSCFAHPDVFHYVGDCDFYVSESERLIRAAIDMRVPLEVNMLGLAEGRHYPNPLFWKSAARLGASVVLGRDAHSTVRVHKEDEFYAAYAFIEKHGLNLIDTIPLGRL